MKTTYLFPNRLKMLSGVLFVISFVVLTALFVFDAYDQFKIKTTVFALFDDAVIGDPVYFGFTKNNISDELLMAIVLCSGIVFAFAKEKPEDEMVATIRLHSLAWATIANYGILLFCYIFIYGLTFLTVLMVAMFSQLLIFIVLFRYKMYRFYNSQQYEE